MDKSTLRIIFMGTPEFAVASLQALVEGGYNVVAVVTQPDKPVGRHQDTLQAPAVKIYAQEHHIPVLQPVKMKDEAFVEQLRSFHADIQAVVAFRMLPEVVWSMPRFGTFNVHAALLPQYRGAAPINWAVINGETQTGVTTFFLDKDIDTGRIIDHKTFDIPDDADVEYVYDGLMHLGAQLCCETIDRVIACNGDVPSTPQEDGGDLKMAPKIFKETCEINWCQPTKHVYDFIRGLSPYPGAWSTLQMEDGSDTKNPMTLKILKAHKTGEKTKNAQPGTILANKRLLIACEDDWLAIDQLQISGKKRMAATDFLNGMRQISDYRCKAHK